MKIKNALTWGFASICLSLVSCDSGSDSNSSSQTAGEVKDVELFSNAPISASNQRVVLAGSASGKTPITGNYVAKIRINGTLVESMILENDGRVVVDVPRGAALRVDFDAPSVSEVSSVGEVYCFYPDAAGNTVEELVFAGGTASAPGVPAYVCPLDVAGDGRVSLGAGDQTLVGKTFRYDIVETVNESQSGNVTGTLKATIRYQGTVTFGEEFASFAEGTETLISLSGTGDLSSVTTWEGSLSVGQTATNIAETAPYNYDENTGRIIFDNDTDGAGILNLSEGTFNASGSDSYTHDEDPGTTITETWSETGTYVEVQ